MKEAIEKELNDIITICNTEPHTTTDKVISNLANRALILIRSQPSAGELSSDLGLLIRKYTGGPGFSLDQTSQELIQRTRIKLDRQDARIKELEKQPGGEFTKKFREQLKRKKTTFGFAIYVNAIEACDIIDRQAGEKEEILDRVKSSENLKLLAMQAREEVEAELKDKDAEIKKLRK